MNKTPHLGFDFDKPNKDLVYAQPKAYEFTYYLSDCVQDSHEYHELLQLLDNAGENDLVRLVINNYGGDAGTCVQLVDHIRNCKATVVGILSGSAFSAAGVVFLACDEQVVADHSMLMIHNAVGGASGSFSEMAKKIAAVNKQTELLYQDVFRHFLTEDELLAVARGEEFWFVYTEILERLEKREELLKAEHEEYMGACQKQLNELFGEPEEEVIPDWILFNKSVTKATLAKIIKKEVTVTNIDEENKTFELIAVDKQ